MHLLDDLHALVQADLPDVESDAAPIYLTTLRPTSPLILLNVSLGDMASWRSARAAARSRRSAGADMCGPSGATTSSPLAA